MPHLVDHSRRGSRRSSLFRCDIAIMGVDHGGTCGPSQNLERGALMQIVPPDIVIGTGTKMSVLWPSKYAKIRIRPGQPGLCPGSRWGSSRRSPRPLSRLERGHPFPYLTPLGTEPPSALAMRPPPRSPARSTPDSDHPPESLVFAAPLRHRSRRPEKLVSAAPL